MGLLVANNIEASDYLDLLDVAPGPDRRVFGSATDPAVKYLDRDDRLIGHWGVDVGGTRSGIWDPNLIDSTSDRVGDFVSPLGGGNQYSAPYFLGDHEPGGTTQRLFQCLGGGIFNELLYNDPTQFAPVQDPFPLIDRAGPDDFAPGVEGHWSPISNTGDFVFFPGLDFAILANGRVYEGAGPTIKDNCVIGFSISTGFGQPLNKPGANPYSPTGGNAIGRYATGEHEFNRGPIFGEATVVFAHIQFLPDSTSTHAQPRGELFMWSAMTDAGGDTGRIYVQFIDFDPFNLPAVPGETPSRVHLRQTLLSRVVVQDTIRPVGNPPVPLNGWIIDHANSSRIPAFFSTFGAKRMHFLHSDQTVPQGAETWLLVVSKAAIPALISMPSPKGVTDTNGQVAYQCQVTGDLQEPIANAIVTFSIARGSTVSEVLATTPTAGETVVVENLPIDREIEFGAGFAIFEDALELTEGVHYDVDEALGEIQFIGPKPLDPGSGEVYTARYAHPAAPAVPAHGTVIDGSIFSTVLGVAESRILFPNNDELAGHIDLVTASTPT